MSLLDRFTVLFETDSAEASQNVDELHKKLKDTERGANDATGAMDDASNSADDMGVNFAAAAKTAAALLASFVALDAIKDTITQTALMTDTLGKLTTTMGFNIQQMDAWGAAAERNGGSAAALQSSVIGLQDQLSDIQFGGGQQIIQDLAMMGVSAFNSNGQIKDTFDLLEDVSGVFEGMSARQSSSFGKRLGLDQGTILLLQQGRVGVQQLVEQQERLGSANEEAYLAAADFNDAQDNINRSLNSVFQTINAKILPVFTAFLNGITGIVTWMRENEDFTIGFFVALGSTIAYVVLPAVKSLAVAVWGLAAPFALPIAAVAALAAAFALLFEDVKAYIEGNDSLIGDLAKKYEWFGDIVDGLIEGFKMFWDDLNALFDWTILFAQNPIEAINVAISKLKQEFTDLWSWIKQLFDFSFLGEAVTGAFGSMKDFFGFGDSEMIGQISANTEKAMMVSGAYAANPLNTAPSYQYATSQRSSYNNYSFHNSIQAKGVTPEQVSQQLNDEFGRQLAAAGSLSDDGINY